MEELVRSGANLRSEAVVLEKAVRTGDRATVHRILGLMDDRALIADAAGERESAQAMREGRVVLAKATGLAPVGNNGALNAHSSGYRLALLPRPASFGPPTPSSGRTLPAALSAANGSLPRGTGHDLSPRLEGASPAQPTPFSQPTPPLDHPGSLVAPPQTPPRRTGYDFTVPSLKARPFDDGVYRTFGLDIGHSFGGTYGEIATRAARPFQNIVIHHTTGGHNLADHVAYGHRIDTERDEPGAYGYHFYIGADGTIVQGAPMWARTNGQPGYGVFRNANSIHVALTGDHTDWTAEQIAAATALVQALAADYDINAERIVNHGNLQAGQEEGRNPALWQVLENVGALDNNVLRPGHGTGIFEPDDRVRAVQLFLQSIPAGDGGTPGLSIDGDYGPGTLAAVRRFQAEYGLADTGQVDRATQRAILDYALSHGLTPPEFLGGQ